MKYRYRGNRPADLADGRIVASDETVELSAAAVKLPHNARLIERGDLLPLKTTTKADKGSAGKDDEA